MQQCFFSLFSSKTYLKGRNHVLTNILETYNVQKGKHSNSYRQGIQLLKTQKMTLYGLIYSKRELSSK